MGRFGEDEYPRDDDDDRYRDVDDDEEADEDDDDDAGSRLDRSRFSPYTSSGSGSGSGGLRSGLPGSSAASSAYGSRFGSGSEAGSGGSGSGSGLRPSSPGGPQSPSSPGSRFSPSGGSGSSSGGGLSSRLPGSVGPNRDTGEQPAAPRYNPSSGSGSSSGGGLSSRLPGSVGPNRDTGEQPAVPRYNPSSGGGAPGARPSAPGSPIRSPDAPGSSSGSSISRGDLSARYPGSGGLSGSLRSPAETSGRPEERKPGADPKKPTDEKKDAPAQSGFGARLSGVAGGLRGGEEKKDDKKDKDTKKPDAKKDEGGGGIGARLGGLTSGLASRFGGGKTEEKKDDPKRPGDSGARPGSSPMSPGAGSSGYGGASRYGASGGPGGTTSSSPSGVRPSSPSNPLPSAGASRQSPFGQRATGTQTTSGAASSAKPAAKPAPGGLGARFAALTQSLPLFGRKDAKASKKPRAAKVPEVRKSEGMSLDTKLDILGVVCVFASLIVFFSALSTNQGAITGQLNLWLGRMLGWGALAVPVGLLVVGLWLIMRHFGDQAPVIEPLRVIGVVMIYVGLLVAFQFIESLNYTGDRAVQTLNDLRMQVQVSYEAYRAGGGWLGGQLYYFLVSNITEVGAFFTVLGWMFIGFMLFADLSASEVAIVIISLWRSFNDSLKRQRQRRSARIAELQTQRAAQQAALAAQQAAAPQIAVSRPAPSELPAAAPAGALPAPAATSVAMNVPTTPAEERSIPMRLGGRSEMLKVEGAQPPRPPGVAGTPSPAIPAATASITPEKKEEEAPSGGVGARLRGMLGGKSSTETPAAPPVTSAPGEKAAAAATSLSSRLFGRSESKPAEASTPAASTQQAAGSLASRLFNRPGAEKPASGGAAPASPTSSVTAPRPAAPPLPTTPPAAAKPGEEPSARRGELLRPGAPERSAAAAAPSPFSRPAAAPLSPLPRPFDEDDETDEEEPALDLSPARPKGLGPAPRPASPLSPSATTPAGENEAQKAAPPVAPPAGSSLSERMERLNALRSGTATPPAATTTPLAGTKPGESEKSAQTPAKPGETPAAGMGARVRPFSFGEHSDKPAATVSASVVGGGAKEAEDKKPGAFAPAGPAVAAAPKISIPTGHPDTPPAPAPAAPTSIFGAQTVRKPKREWKLPNFQTLLASGSDQDFDREFLSQRARIIEETLQSFGAPGKVVEINTGPVITQFGVEPDYLMSRSGKKNRIKVSAIAALDKDLQLALGAKSIRIEAPVPGKGFVGVEVPNEEAALVSLRDVMDSDEFKKIDSPLTIALGQSVDGTPVAANLDSMPHLLIAGTTGSGKSVCVNAIISSLVLRNSPEHLKFIMVDPKRVELTGYNGIPHLIAPVVVELERIVGVLKWVTREMDERYKRFSQAGARNIEDFNQHLAPDAEFMPYIIVIIDELADLMMLAPDETERVITRIAALARATGIHLVIATQRPSVDVVTGLIKANFPARIAFAVASSVDSRVILDQPGAERLLGRGDMLYMSGDSPAPVRLQGVYVSDIEIGNIVRYWKQQTDEAGPMSVPQLVLDKTLASDPASPPRSASAPAQPPRVAPPMQQAFWDRDRGAAREDEDEDGYDDEIEDADGDGEDDMYEEAVDLVRKLNKASVSLLQRRLRIGYTRAARLIDLMEERGVVGPAESGSKPRDVLPSKD